MITTTSNKYKSTVLMLLSATLVILCFQLLLFIPQLKPLVHSGIFATVTLPVIMWRGVAFCLFAHLLCWTGFTLLVAVISISIDKLFILSSNKLRHVALAIWFCGIMAIFLFNQLYFPRSLFADFTMTFLNNSCATFIVVISVALFIAAALVALFSLIKLGLVYPRLLVLISILSVLIIIYLFCNHTASTTKSTQYPNIIIIGLDSVRPDFVDFYTHKNTHITPYLDQFLSQSINFTQAISPLGQTYPAWASILTGLYPKHNGARYDLAPLQDINLSDSINSYTSKLGYLNIYATDERRFSNIDENYGFDTIIGPSLGINDFLLGMFNDFPLSNIISNTYFGKWLFPYNHSNRASNLNYYPGTFTQDIKRSLMSIPQTTPIFLALHLCISHWPYVWAATNRDAFHQQLIESYTDAVTQVDLQFGDIYQFLKQQGFLNNAIVLLVSDHGESLDIPGDRLTIATNNSLGHGTDVLSPSQYHIVMALRFYDLAHHQVSTSAKFVDSRVSLTDIKATILDFINVINYRSDGISLLSLLSGSNKQAIERFIFNESGFAPDIIFSQKFNFQKLLKFFMENYQVDPKTSLINVTANTAHNIIQHKQRAVFYKQWLLAHYPGGIFVLVNLDTHQWTDNLNSDFAKQSPVALMLQQLQDFYGNELNL